MILSIIIPVFNVEKYVATCIESCYEQDLSIDEYELVVVNDGSTDGSLNVINNLSKMHTNLTVITKENGGLSSARNIGMERAKGEYYMFLDSDDWIEKKCLHNITEHLRTEKPDAMAICAADVIDDKDIRRQGYKDTRPIVGRDLFRNGVQVCAPFAIWNANFLKRNKLYFFEGIYHEDEEFTPRAFYLANKVTFTNDIIYKIRQNPTSITRTSNPKKSFDLINVVCEHLYVFSSDVLDDYKPAYYDKIGSLVAGAFRKSKTESPNVKRQLIEALERHPEYSNVMMKGHKRRNRLMGFLIRIFPENVYSIVAVVDGLLWFPVFVKSLLRKVNIISVYN